MDALIATIAIAATLSAGVWAGEAISDAVVAAGERIFAQEPVTRQAAAGG